MDAFGYGNAGFVTTTSLRTMLGLIGIAKIREARISFAGVTAAHAPILVELYFFGTNGTGTSGAAYPADRAANPTSGVTVKYDYSAEPSSGLEVFSAEYVHPQGGQAIWTFDELNAPRTTASKGFGIRVTAANSIACSVAFGWEE